MRIVKVGTSGLSVSKLCLGTMNFGGVTAEDEAVRIMSSAVDAGISFFDTSNLYGGKGEEALGRGLRELKIRDRVVLATKVFFPVGTGPNDRGASRAHIVREIENQLWRLQTEWIDLYYLHRPDFDTPLEETVETLDALVRSGKIRHWGTSTFPAWRVAEAWWRAERRGWAHPIAEQAPYNLLDRRVETDRASFLREYGLGLVTWSPLAGGLLTGKYRQSHIDRAPAGTRLADMKEHYRARVGPSALSKAREIAGLARDAGLDPVQFAIAWLLGRPMVTAVVIGPRTSAQLRPYLDAMALKIKEDLLEAADRIVAPGAAYMDFHNTSGWFAGPLTQAHRR